MEPRLISRGNDNLAMNLNIVAKTLQWGRD